MELRKYIERLNDNNWEQFTTFVKSWFHDRYILTIKEFVEWQYKTPFSKTSNYLNLEEAKI